MPYAAPAQSSPIKSRLCHSVTPTEVEGSRSVCGAQEVAPRRVKRMRMCRDLRMRPWDGARSLDCARDDGNASAFVQCREADGLVRS
jgi:hypothetical protein